MEIEKDFIISESSNLDIEDRIEILVIVRRFNPKFIIEKKDGSRIRLDKLPNEVILQIHNFMRRRLEMDD